MNACDPGDHPVTGISEGGSAQSGSAERAGRSCASSLEDDPFCVAAEWYVRLAEATGKDEPASEFQLWRNERAEHRQTWAEVETMLHAILALGQSPEILSLRSATMQRVGSTNLHKAK